MPLRGLRPHNVVVKITEKGGAWSENLVHEPLECLSGILQTKWHEEILIQPNWRVDGSFRDVFLGNGYLMVSLDEVNLRKIPTTVEFV